MSADREAANERAGRIEVEGDKPKVEPTLRYFAEVRASLKNGQDALRDIEAELAATREQLREVSRKFTLAEEDARLFRDREEKLREALRVIHETASWYADNPVRLPHEVDHALCVEIVSYADAALADGEGET